MLLNFVRLALLILGILVVFFMMNDGYYIRAVVTISLLIPTFTYFIKISNKENK